MYHQGFHFLAVLPILQQILSPSLAFAAAASLAPLEQPDGTGIHLGAWYDRKSNDTPIAMLGRLGFASSTNASIQARALSFWQCNLDMGLNGFDGYGIMDQFIAQVTAANTTAFLYLTIYPMDGFDAVTDASIQQMVAAVLEVVKSGSKILIRYASEMNGSWFAYGQQPTAFKDSWTKVVTTVRNATLAYPGAVAFLWAPNLGTGYPFSGYGILPFTTTSGFDPTADTNKNGKMDSLDDPYSPYYPGDDLVDWVGLSVYHYANVWPYVTNDIPPSYKLEMFMSPPASNPKDYGYFNFYEMFSGGGAGGQPVSQSAGGKPFFLSETGAAIHIEVVDAANVWTKVATASQGAGSYRAAIKQAWWRQFINSDFLATYPRFKGASFFEFTKPEDTTIRDFTNLGKGTNYTTPLGDDAEALDDPTLQAFQSDMLSSLGDLILWAKNNQSPTPPTIFVTSSTSQQAQPSNVLLATGSTSSSSKTSGGASMATSASSSNGQSAPESEGKLMISTIFTALLSLFAL